MKPDETAAKVKDHLIRVRSHKTRDQNGEGLVLQNK